MRILRESCSSDTARAMVMAPTSAQYVMIARDLAAHLSFSLVSRIKFANHSKFSEISLVARARVRSQAPDKSPRDASTKGKTAVRIPRPSMKSSLRQASFILSLPSSLR